MSALLCSRHLGNLGCPCLKIFKHNLVRAGADPSHLALVAARSGSGSGPVWSKHKFIESGFVPSRVRFASLASRSGSVGFRLRRETHRAWDSFSAPQQKPRTESSGITQQRVGTKRYILADNKNHLVEELASSNSKTRWRQDISFTAWHCDLTRHKWRQG